MIIINALGPLKVDGMMAAADAADAMLKTVSVCLPSHEALNPGRLILVVEGDLAACRAALDVGSTVAIRTGRAISREEIGRPDGDTRWLIGSFKRQSKKPEQKPEAKTETEPEETQDAPVTSESSV